jgi:hypothetical protein
MTAEEARLAARLREIVENFMPNGTRAHFDALDAADALDASATLREALREIRRAEWDANSKETPFQFEQRLHAIAHAALSAAGTEAEPEQDLGVAEEAREPNPERVTDDQLPCLKPSHERLAAQVVELREALEYTMHFADTLAESSYNSVADGVWVKQKARAILTQSRAALSAAAGGSR